MKRKVSFALCLLLCLCFSVSFAFAVPPGKLIDHAGLIPDSAENEIMQALQQLSDEIDADVVVLTEKTLGSTDAKTYADNYFDDHGYGRGDDRSGVLLLRSLDPKYVYISTSGAVRYVLDDAVELIIDAIADDIINGDYEAACYGFIEQVREFSAFYPTDFGDGAYAEDVWESEDDFYDYYYPSDLSGIKKEPNALAALGICVILGVAAAIIIVALMKRKHISVRKKRAADDYLVEGSVRLTRADEIFLYRNVNRVRRSEDNHTSTGGHSSSGSHSVSSGSHSSHGGGGRAI